jgi:hypothetical protein
MELPYGLTPKQAATVAFIATFVTSSAGFYWRSGFVAKTERETNA